jgi:isoquinoline 1-oxidoreductase subunit beta
LSTQFRAAALRKDFGARVVDVPGGMGEAGTSAIVPAIANAIYAATGKRLRKMPIDAASLKKPA